MRTYITLCDCIGKTLSGVQLKLMRNSISNDIDVVNFAVHDTTAYNNTALGKSKVDPLTNWKSLYA